MILMADRRIPIVIGEFYHVFNRGVARQPAFLNQRDYKQALLTLSYYRFKKPPVKLSRFKELSLDERDKILAELQKLSDLQVKIISYVLMPNHFHFLLQQTAESGIANFIGKFTNSYSKYFNIRQDRVGPVFQGVYKAVHIESDEQLIHVSRYIHLNPVVSGVVRKTELEHYPWSSLPDFLQGESSLVWVEPILGHFPSPKDYKKFVYDQIDYAKRLEEIKHLLIE